MNRQDEQRSWTEQMNRQPLFLSVVVMSRIMIPPQVRGKKSWSSRPSSELSGNVCETNTCIEPVPIRFPFPCHLNLYPLLLTRSTNAVLTDLTVPYLWEKSMPRFELGISCSVGRRSIHCATRTYWPTGSAVKFKLHRSDRFIFSVHLLCSSSLFFFSIHLLCSSSLFIFSVHLLCSNSVHVRFIFCSSSVHPLFVFCSFCLHPSVHPLCILCSSWANPLFIFGSSSAHPQNKNTPDEDRTRDLVRVGHTW